MDDVIEVSADGVFDIPVTANQARPGSDDNDEIPKV